MLQQLFKRKKSLPSPRARAGFTLIELLVIAAIISLLASVILVAMGESRKEARDAAIKTSLTEIRKAAALLYDKKGTYESDEGVCDATDTTLSDSGDFGRIKDYIEKQNGVVSCNDTNTGYAVISSLNKGNCWCIDWQGDSKEVELSGEESCASVLTATECPQ